MIHVATLIPQHDDEGRSATILPGVPLPDWAFPAGPIEPEPVATEEPSPVRAEVEAPIPELVSVGAPAAFAAPVTAPVAEPVAPTAYAAPLTIGANGPGPMRAGWDYPGSDFREQAHDAAVADAAVLDDTSAADLTLETAVVPTEPESLTDSPVIPDDVSSLEVPPSEVALPAPVVESTGVSESETDEGSGEALETGDDDATTTSRHNLVALGALGAVVVLGAVAAFVWPGLLVSHDPDPAPAAIAPVTAPVAQPVVVTTPASIGSLVKLTGTADAALSKAVTGSALPGLTGPVSAVYGTGTTPAVTVIAWTSTAPVEASSIPAAFAGFLGATSSAVTAISTTPVSATGEMQCGTTVVAGVPASLCFWADSATFGSVTVFNPATPEAAADTAIEVRAAVVGG